MMVVINSLLIFLIRCFCVFWYLLRPALLIPVAGAPRDSITTAVVILAMVDADVMDGTTLLALPRVLVIVLPRLLL